MHGIESCISASSLLPLPLPATSTLCASSSLLCLSHYVYKLTHLCLGGSVTLFGGDDLFIRSGCECYLRLVVYEFLLYLTVLGRTEVQIDL